MVGGSSDRYTQDVFRSLGEGATRLLDRLTLRAMTLPPNRPLLVAGEVGTSLFRIEQGWAFRFQRDGDGCRQILDFLMPGELLGLHPALLGLGGHSVHSLTALRVRVLDARLVTEAFNGEPELALRLARHLAAEAARVDELLAVVGCRDAVQRLAFLMASLYLRQRHSFQVDPLDCPFPLRRQHMADALGLTGAHVNRTLNRLRHDSIAVVDKDRLAIRDLPRLGALASISL